jgi:hypothetical protein
MLSLSLDPVCCACAPGVIDFTLMLHSACSRWRVSWATLREPSPNLPPRARCLHFLAIEIAPSLRRTTRHCSNDHSPSALSRCSRASTNGAAAAGKLVGLTTMDRAWELASILSERVYKRPFSPIARNRRPGPVGLRIRRYFVSAGCANSSRNAFRKIFPTFVLGRSGLK